MTTVVSVEGDVLDEIVAPHYGAAFVSDAIAAVLSANIGLGLIGPSLPTGTRIALPELSGITRHRPRLWV